MIVLSESIQDCGTRVTKKNSNQVNRITRSVADEESQDGNPQKNRNHKQKTPDNVANETRQNNASANCAEDELNILVITYSSTSGLFNSWIWHHLCSLQLLVYQLWSVRSRKCMCAGYWYPIPRCGRSWSSSGWIRCGLGIAKLGTRTLYGRLQSYRGRSSDARTICLIPFPLHQGILWTWYQPSPLNHACISIMMAGLKRRDIVMIPWRVVEHSKPSSFWARCPRANFGMSFRYG